MGEFDVYETNLDGVPLDTRGQAIKREKVLHECTVLLKDDMDFSKAEFIVDGVHFQDLSLKETVYAEENVSMDLDTFIGTYGPIVPRKINREAPTGLVGGFKAFVSERGAADSATAVAGLTVMRAAATDGARSGVVAAVSAAVSGAEAMSTAAIDYSPAVAEAAEQTAKKAGHSLSGMFSWFCAGNNVEESIEVFEVEQPLEHTRQDHNVEAVVAPAGVSYLTSINAPARVSYMAS